MKMSNTCLYQEYPDFFNSPEIANQKRLKKQSNPRYKNFKQNNFTAGDIDQFDQFRNNIGGKQAKYIFNNNYWDLYHKINHQDVTNTFRYIFDKFKKGIFIKIKEGKLDVFLPFSKYNYVNEWSDKINTKDFHKLAYYACQKNGYVFNKKNINNTKERWYSNNGLVRYEFPINEGETNIGIIKNMLEEVCKDKDIPDFEFFINKRDFPILKKNKTEAYNNMWDSENHPLVSHSYNKYCPILSMVTSDDFADIAMPTHNDWARVSSYEGKWFERSVDNFNNSFNIEWKDKIPTAIFRGSSTGIGTTIETNPRLKVSHLSVNTPNGEDGFKLIDAGITKWNLRPRKIEGNSVLQTIIPENLGFGLVNFMSYEEQSKYKYIIHIEGHVESFRLSTELSMGSVVLLVESKWKLWYSDKLIPWVHFIPIKKDLSDLVENILWCKANDKKCQDIAQNARNFYDSNLNKKSIIENMKKTLIELSGICSIPSYPDKKPIDSMIEFEEKWINESIKSASCDTIRNNKCIQNIINNMIIKNHDFFKNSTVLYSNKVTNVFKNTINGCDIVIKNTEDKFKSKEHIHETFISLSCLNDISKNIPNFAYIFGSYKKDDSYNILIEYINGKTLYDYLICDYFDIAIFKCIMVQICLALHVANEKHNFVHWDITPWNVIIKDYREYITIGYTVNKKTIYIKSKNIPVIFDYGKSTITLGNKVHGILNLDYSNNSNDIRIMILSCIKVLLKRRCNQDTIRFIFNIFNFINHKNKPINNLKEIKNFLAINSKYDSLIDYEKNKNHGEKTCYDIACYILDYKY